MKVAAPVTAARAATPTRSKASSPALKQDEDLLAKVSTLEAQITTLQAQLEQRQTDIAGHESSLAELKSASEGASAARDALESELALSKEALELSLKEKGKIQSVVEETKNQLIEVASKVGFVNLWRAGTHLGVIPAPNQGIGERRSRFPNPTV